MRWTVTTFWRTQKFRSYILLRTVTARPLQQNPLSDLALDTECLLVRSDMWGILSLYYGNHYIKRDPHDTDK